MLIYLYWFPCLIFLWVIGYNFKFWLTESPVTFRNILNSLLPFCNPLELISITFWLNQAHSLWLILYFNVRKSEPVYTGFSSDAIWVSNKTNFGINMRNSMCYRSKSFLVLVLVLRWTSGVVEGWQYTTGSSIQSQTVNPSKHATEIHIMKLWTYEKSYIKLLSGELYEGRSSQLYTQFLQLLKES